MYAYNGLSHTTYAAYPPDTGLGEAFSGCRVELREPEEIPDAL